VQKLHEFQRKAERQAARAVEESASLEPSSPFQQEITIIQENEQPNAFAQLWENLA